MLGGGSIDSAKSLANRTPTRGFGYWCWKPYIILKTLEQLENNDILLYADIGCTFHPKYREKLLDMISLVNQNEIMGFMMSYPEYQYTKYYRHGTSSWWVDLYEKNAFKPRGYKQMA
ncbi:hypothetical protein [Helicobacter japonicus]|uniref:Uncharacterized protein n=1 Tax=Helicobacter japonicus TaxID=425400 RepID=A0A4U8TU02_9HELI|nr:hypothetical protein [Helicobacter japonicus]TLE03345.1 hypothetical protein LS65_000820 [Helicobacter japonicus]